MSALEETEFFQVYKSRELGLDDFIRTYDNCSAEELATILKPLGIGMACVDLCDDEES